MPSQGYERVRSRPVASPAHRFHQSDYTDIDMQVQDNDPDSHFSSQPIPNSPPPSFHSRSTSPVSHASRSNGESVDQTLADAFDGDDGDSDDEQEDDRQRLIRSGSAPSDTPTPGSLPRRQTEIPSFIPTGPRQNSTNPRTYISSNDGVFGNINAKPQVGDNEEELPPSYEQAAADATPPYWETTLMAPGMMSDEVYIDGLPVGSVFSFAWNGIIAMAFPLVGFLLTYLLHTTHAARNGSRAGLGVTLINYGFTMRDAAKSGGESGDGRPADPNAHDFDPNAGDVYADPSGGQAGGDAAASFASGDWLAYLLMIAGWVILIKAVTDFVRARRHEQLVLQSPERNLPVPIVAEGETSESAV